MTIAKIRELLFERPFRPLVVYLSDGRHFLIEHPEMAIITKHALYIFQPVKESELGEVAMSPAVVSYLHITSVEYLPEKAA